MWFAASLKFLVPFAALAALGAWLLPQPSSPLPMLGGLAPVSEPFVMPVSKTDLLGAVASQSSTPDSIGMLFAIWSIGTLSLALHWLSGLREIRVARSLYVVKPVWTRRL